MSHLVVIQLSFLALGAIAMPAADTPGGDNKVPSTATAMQAEHIQLLSRARAVNNDVYFALKSFVCREEIERYKDDLKKSKTRLIDHVSTNLSFENGIEHYNDVRQNERSVNSLPEIMGAWSEGEFGTLLQQTRKLLELQPVNFVAFEAINGIQTAVYRFVVPEKDSPWDLSVGSQHYKIPFTTDVWISVSTGEILKIARKSLAMSPETRISEIDWDVSLGAVELSGRTWLLPTLARYSVSYGESKRREWNQMSFSNYHHYGSESSLKFENFK